jgi:hypothetical protein
VFNTEHRQKKSKKFHCLGRAVLLPTEIACDVPAGGSDGEPALFRQLEGLVSQQLPHPSPLQAARHVRRVYVYGIAIGSVKKKRNPVQKCKKVNYERDNK